MPNDDERDKYVPKVPPEGVRAQTATPVEIHDELTPVEGTPFIQAQKRSEKTAERMKAALHSIRTVEKNQTDLAAQVKAYAETDQADHKEMKEDNKSIKQEVKDGFTVVHEHIGNLRESVASAEGKLDILVGNHRTDRKYKNETKTATWKTLLRIFGAIVTAGGTIIASYYATKYFHS